MGEMADYYIDRQIDRHMDYCDSPFGAGQRPDPLTPEHRAWVDYWDSQYDKPEAWMRVRSLRPLKQTDKALIVTLDDGEEMWVPKYICTTWRTFVFDVHIEHYEKLLKEQRGMTDLLPDLPDGDDD